MSAICAVLIFIFSCFMAARYWSHALSGSLSTSVVTKLIAYRSIIALELLLPVALYLSVIMATSRFIRQMEFTAMLACGIGPGRLIKAVFSFAIFIAIFVASLSLYVRPLAWDHFFHLKALAKSTFDLSRMNSGIFYEVWEGKRVIFAERVSRKKNRAKNVFIRTKGPEGVQVVYAKSARQLPARAGGSPVLVLENGREYEFSERGENDFILEFKSSTMVLEPRLIEPEQKIKAVPTKLLVKNQGLEEEAELQWRLLMPVSTILLALCAIGVALRFTSVRGGRNSGLIMGILVFAIYYNLIAFLKKWVAGGEVPVMPGLSLGALFLVLLCILFFLPEIRGAFLQARARGAG